MKIAYIFILCIVAVWLYTIVVTDPPYGLDEVPPTTDWITTKNLR